MDRQRTSPPPISVYSISWPNKENYLYEHLHMARGDSLSLSAGAGHGLTQVVVWGGSEQVEASTGELDSSGLQDHSVGCGRHLYGPGPVRHSAPGPLGPPPSLPPSPESLSREGP